MPHHPKPFYRPARGLWYIQVRGKQHNLGPCRDREEAEERAVELKKTLREVAPSTPRRPVASDSVLGVLDDFLAWCHSNKAARTYDGYRNSLESFARTVPKDLSVAELKPIHVQRWVDAQPGWKTGKRGAIVAVQRAFNWADKQGLIASNPVRHVEKPRAARRELVITLEQFSWILGQVKDRPFRDLMIVCWETGCRPQEILAVESRHVDAKGSLWVFPPDEAKGKRAHRVVYLTEAALEVTRHLAKERRDGPLFLYTDGRPWTPYALNCRFRRLRAALGRGQVERLGLIPTKTERLIKAQRLDAAVREEHLRAVDRRRREILELSLRHGTKWCLYNFRHSFATRLLESGIDSLTVSSLLGHADGAMLAKVYSHLSKNGEYLRSALRGAGA